MQPVGSERTVGKESPVIGVDTFPGVQHWLDSIDARRGHTCTVVMDNSDLATLIPWSTAIAPVVKDRWVREGCSSGVGYVSPRVGPRWREAYEDSDDCRMFYKLHVHYAI